MICFVKCSQIPPNKNKSLFALYSLTFCIFLSAFPYIHTYIHAHWYILCAGLFSLRAIRVKTSERVTTETSQSQFDLLYKWGFTLLPLPFLKVHNSSFPVSVD